MKKNKNATNREIEQLKAQRRILVEKNLNGIYSDEIFKKQSALIEERMLKIQFVKEDATIEKHNIDELTTLIKTLLADLGETYKRSNLKQLKVL